MIKIVTSRGAHVIDECGRELLDFTSQGGLLGLGHAHPELRAVGLQQLGKLGYIHERYEFVSRVSCCGEPMEVSRPAVHAALSEVASRIMSVGRTLLNVSGSAALLTALKFARVAQVCRAAPAAEKEALLRGDRRFPSFGVLAFEGVYHGQLGEAHQLSDTAAAEARGAAAGLIVRRIPRPIANTGVDRDEYRAVARSALDTMVRDLGWRALAIVVEAFGGWGEEYDAELLIDLAAEARARGMFVIVDEFKTGQGRTGRQFACERVGLRPDFVVFSKILTGGHPSGAVAVARDVELADAGPVSDHGTFSAAPMACASILAVLRILDRERLIEAADERGRDLREALRAEFRGADAVRAVSGKGLLSCLVMRDERTRDALSQTALEGGLLTSPHGRGFGRPLIVLMPPLVVTAQEVAKAVAILAQSARVMH